MLWGITFGLIVIALIALPPKWDPAIRFKEWIEKDRPHDR